MVAMPPIDPGSPPWFQRFAQQLATFMSTPLARPLKLWSVPTVELPAPSDWTGCILYDRTTGQVKVSNGSAWNAL